MSATPWPAGLPLSDMAKLCIFTGMLVVSTAFGLGADALGCGLFGSFLVSGLGALIGCVAGWWVHRRFLP